MSSRTSSRARVPATTLLIGAGVATMAASWLEVTGFAGFIAAALAGVVYVILAGSPLPTRIGAAASSAAFPLLSAGDGEEALLWSCTIAFLVLSLASIIGGLRPRLVPSLALAFLVVSYLSALGAHLVLIKQFRDGGQMVSAFLVIAGGFEAVATFVENKLHPGRRSRPIWPDPRAVLAGMAASWALTYLMKTLFDLPLGIPGVAILGAAIALIGATGNAVGGLVGEGLRTRMRPADLIALRHLNAVLVAAPAFYYGFRLYLS